MSRISLSGNPSGSGTLTIASPNTNSDATFNLPTTGGDLLVNGATQSPTFNAVTATSLAVNGNNISAQNSLGFRNRIINGDMRIDQRNNGASVGTASGSTAYTVDRWQAQYEATSKFTVQQSTLAPAGYVNSLLVTSSSAYSPTSTQWFAVAQNIEGVNIADLGWGTSGAQAITVSFWVRSSLTGAFGGSVTNASWGRSYPFSYTISAANTWEQKTITIAGDTTGTWNTNTSTGITLRFSLGTGSGISNTAGVWYGSQVFAPTGAVSVVGTSGATFYITGVQLEAGSVATPFERRPYGTELALCQRYYQKLGLVSNQLLGFGITQTGSRGAMYCKYATTMRASPTASFSSLSVGDLWNYGRAVTSLAGSFLGIDSAHLVTTIAESDMTAQRAMGMFCNGSTGFIDFSAEL